MILPFPPERTRYSPEWLQQETLLAAAHKDYVYQEYLHLPERREMLQDAWAREDVVKDYSRRAGV